MQPHLLHAPVHRAKKWTEQKSRLLETKEGGVQVEFRSLCLAPEETPGREVASRSKTCTLQWFVELLSGSRAGKRSEVSPLVTTRLWNFVRIPSGKSGG